MKMQYVLKMNGRYLNAFRTFGEAADERDRLERLGYKNLTIVAEYYS